MPRLRVRVIGARNLTTHHIIHTSDGYVFLSVGTETHKTKIIKHNRNPEWDETFHFNVADIKTTSLLAVVYNHDIIKKDVPIGAIGISLEGLHKGQESSKWLVLQGVKHGELHLGLTAEDFDTSTESAPAIPVRPAKLPPKAEPTKKSIPAGISENEVDELRAAFNEFDADHSGHLSRAELKLLLAMTIAHQQQEGILERFVSMEWDSVDSDKNGYIDFHEFLVMWCKLKEWIKSGKHKQ